MQPTKRKFKHVITSLDSPKRWGEKRMKEKIENSRTDLYTNLQYGLKRIRTVQEKKIRVVYKKKKPESGAVS